MQKHEEILFELYIQEQIKLSKWIIALSSGTAIFSVRLVTENTSIFWRYELILGAALLFFSILAGVRYVTLKIESLRNWVVHSTASNDIRAAESVASVESSLKLEKLIEMAKEDKTEAGKNMDKISPQTTTLFRWQHGLFYAGMILIVIFGVFSISK